MVIKVLIVEDSRIVRKVLNDMLRNVGQMSLLNECDSATGAIAALRRDPPDVILLDIQLSEGSGLDVLQIAAAEYPLTKVVVVTNFTDNVYRTHYLRAGAIAFFDKSMEMALLQTFLEQLTHERKAEAGSAGKKTGDVISFVGESGITSTNQ